MISCAFCVKARDIQFSISKEGVITTITEVTFTKNKESSEKNVWQLKKNLKGINNDYSLYLYKTDAFGDAPVNVIQIASPSMMKYLINSYIKNESITAQQLFNKLSSGKYLDNKKNK